MFCRQYLQLAKVRLTAMILLTAPSATCSVRPGRSTGRDWHSALLGTGLAAVGASALNQLLEIGRDAKMRRTCRRPLPAGAISRRHAFLFAMTATAAGLGILNELVNPLTALLGLLGRADLRRWSIRR